MAASQTTALRAGAQYEAFFQLKQPSSRSDLYFIYSSLTSRTPIESRVDLDTADVDVEITAEEEDATQPKSMLGASTVSETNRLPPS